MKTFMSDCHVLGVETSNKKLIKVLEADKYFTNKDVELPNLQYFDQKCSEGVTVNTDYLLQALKVLELSGIEDVRVKVFVAKHYPMTIEGEDFKIIIGACLEDK